MERPLCIASLLLVLSSCAATPPQGPDAPPRMDDEQWVAIHVGRRSLDDDFEPVEDQVFVGGSYARQSPYDPVGFEVGLYASREEDDSGALDIEGRTREIYGGVHKTFGDDVLRPYVGAGLALIQAELDVEGVDDDDDSSIAGYVHGGFRVAVTESFFLGLDLRWLFGSDLEIGGVDTDADYAQLALAFGWSF
jgi:opacity protein-like surface antigen